METDNKQAGSEKLETLEDSGSSAPAPGSEIKPADAGDKDAAGSPLELSGDDKATEPPAKKSKPRRHLRDSSNLYLIVFVVLILVAVVAAVITFNQNDNSGSKAKKASSLTSDQLAQLSGNTTIVGDSKQTLDIQSDTVMEGQLLVRKDLSVAGSIKVGGGLSLTSVQVGGQGNFGQLQINGTLSVSGNTTFSGQLNVKKDLSVAGSGSFGGSLSAAALSVTSLQLNGDLKVNRHIVVGGSIPTRTNGAAIGSGGTTSVNGSDTAGTVTINTGSSPMAGTLITVHFASSFKSAPHVVVTPITSAAAALQYYVTRTSSGFSLLTASAPGAGKSLSFDYIVVN